MIKKNSVTFLLYCILSFIIYANSLNSSFHFDDQHYVVENPYIRKVQNIPLFFQSPRYSSSEKPFTAHYRPLVVSSYAINYWLGGLNPFGYHLVNLGFHAGTAYLLFLIVQALLGSRVEVRSQRSEVRSQKPEKSYFLPLTSNFYMALAAALIFAVHPFNSEVVNYITARSSVMSAFFYLLAFYCWVKYRSQKSEVRKNLTSYFYMASLLAFLLAMLSKEIAITLPAILFLYDTFFVQAGRKIDYLKRLVLYLPFVLSVVIPYLIIRKLFYGHFIASRLNRDFYLNLYTQTKVLIEYISLMFYPKGLTIDHFVKPAHSFYEIEVLFSTLLLIVIIGFACYLWKNGGIWRIVAFFIIWFFVALLPVTLIPLNAIMQENRAYLAGVAFAASAGIGIGKIIVELPSPKKMLPIGLLITLLLVYSAATIQRNRVWKDDVALWTDAVEKAPLSPRSLDNLGLAYSRIGDYERAERYYRKTIQLNPSYLFAYYNLGVLYQKGGEWEKAKSLYQQAIRFDPVYFNAYYNLGLVYSETKEYDRAIEAYKKAISVDKRHGMVYNNLGAVYWAKGEREEAIKSFLKAIEVNPDYLKGYYNLAKAYESTGDYEEAIRVYRNALKIDPGNEEVKGRLEGLFKQ